MKRELLKLWLLADLAISIPVAVLLILVAPERYFLLLRRVVEIGEPLLEKTSQR